MSRFSMEVSEQPRVLALIICERIIVEAETGNVSLIGTFDVFSVESIPTIMPVLNAHISLVKGRDDSNQMFLGLFSPNGDAVIKSVLDVRDWGDGRAQFNLRLPNIPLPIEGPYVLRLFVADQVLSERTLVVQTAPRSPEALGDLPIPEPSP